MINIFFEDVEILGLDPEFFISWLSDACNNENKELEEVNLIFCSDEYLLQKNIEFLQHDYYTDIITFDYCQDNLIMGDLFISKDRVEENAVQNNVTFENELNRVVIHGVLHLCGYKDKSIDEEKLMRNKEDFYLSRIVSRGTSI
jgi:probable rRNA maturation factor